MRRVLSYGLAPAGEFRRSNVETAPATADHTRLVLIPADVLHNNSFTPVVVALSVAASRRGNRCRVHQKRRYGVAESLHAVRLPVPSASRRTPEGHPIFTVLMPWSVMRRAFTPCVAPSASFLQHTRLGRRHLGHEERAGQAASAPFFRAWTRLCLGNCWELCSPSARAVSRCGAKQGRCAKATL